MRLFVALVPPVAVLDDLDRAVGALRTARTDLRWSVRSDWHVTLAFLGEVAAPAADRLGPELGGGARPPPPPPARVGGGGGGAGGGPAPAGAGAAPPPAPPAVPGLFRGGRVPGGPGSGPG